MNKRQEANLRVKVHITAALLKLLDEKSISDITISEIIAEAGVARASFYRNYASKESVITTLITDILEQFRREVQYDGENYYTYENIHRSFEYFSRYGKQIFDLHRFGYGSLILEKLNQLHEEIAGTMPHRLNGTGCIFTLGLCTTQVLCGFKTGSRKAWMRFLKCSIVSADFQTWNRPAERCTNLMVKYSGLRNHEPSRV